MADIRRGSQSQLLRDSYRSSCNSTPETKVATLAAPLTNGHQRNPLLQALADHVNMESTSGGSTTSSTATTATATMIGRNGHSGHSEIQFDEREIYYVSPSKRKGSLTAAPPPLRSSLRMRSFSPTSAAAIAPTYPAVTPSAAYGARAAGELHDFSFDSYETTSHYSDTAMQMLRSGSCSGDVGLAAQSNLLGSAAAVGQCSSSSSSLAQQQTTARGHNNVVTFSNCVDAPRNVNPSASASASATASSHRGSLRRHKGRSNQSLCSCDAAADTEINPDPTLPLYQYSLERRPKGHTYTCEQNAQILLRLQRERNRKLSLGGGSVKDDGQSDTQSSSDVDAIPPVPPPPSLKRNASLRSLRLLQQQQQQRPASTSSNSTTNNNTASNTIATLCNGEMLNDCVNSALDISSVLDNCTTSILKCANAVGAEIMAATTTNKSNVATLANMASNSKPDVCHVTTSFSNYPPPPCIRDDIYTPHTKKSDPALCFLHSAGIDAAAAAAAATTKSQRDLQQQCSLLSLNKYNTIGPAGGQLLTKYGLPWHATPPTSNRISDSCRCFSQSFSSFSRDYFGQQARNNASINRDNHINNNNNSSSGKMIFHTSGDDESDWLPPPPIVSRSYSNLIDIDGGGAGGGGLGVAGGGGGHHRLLPYQKLHTPANMFNKSSSSCSFAAAQLLNNTSASSFTTLNSGSNSGLKEKFHQHQHQQHQHQHQQLLPPSHHQHHQHQHPHHHHHDHEHEHHHHHASLMTGQHSHTHDSQRQLSAAQQQKQHQLHSSVTSIMPWKHRQCPSRGSSSSGTNSFRFDATKHWLAVSSILLIIGAASVAVPMVIRVAASAPFEERLRAAVQLLDQVPLIDGHNDLPWNIRKFLHNKLNDFNFDEDLRNVMPWARSHWSHTDLQRLKKGRISAQFWAAYVPCEAQHRDAVQLTLEQIDVIKRLTDRYSPQLTTCTSSEDIIAAHKNQQLCSLTGVEGGHSLGGSLAVLRTLYAIGVRYMTLTSTCHTPWADSSYADAPTFNVKHGGLTIFGKTIIREMNRLGMMVDLSHVSTGTMRDALEVSEAPVIFSHSSAYELCNSSRNVQDDMLQSLAKNGGLVMVNFYSKFLSCSENATVRDAVAHINHIKRVAGIDHVGLGAGYDGINFTPKGLEDVSSYPTLFAELLGGGWSVEDLTKLAGGNFLRVMKEVEKIRDEKKTAGVKPYEDHPNFRTDDPYNCTSS